MRPVLEPKISLNVINWSSLPQLRLFLSTIPTITDNFNTELVVVDRYSKDGSYEKLKEIADIIVQGDWNRGAARQKAMELCSGDIIINHLDCDMTVEPICKKLIGLYTKYVKSTDFALATHGFLIGWREIIMSAKYLPCHRREDLNYHDQLYKKNKLRTLYGHPKPCIHKHGKQRRSGKAFGDHSRCKTIRSVFRKDIRLEYENLQEGEIG